jgi:sRNA-binding carbon storage regulator CsrA
MSRRRAPAVAMPTGQLVLTRRINQQILLTIGGVSGTITLADIRTPGDKPRAVRIAMRFPPEVQILRAELLKGGGGDE